MRISLLGGLWLAVSLAACSPGTRPDAVPMDSATDGVSADAAACAAQGGELRPLGRLQRMQCVVPYADAGKTCSTRSDCTGHCLAAGDVAMGVPVSGKCQRDASENFGCRQRIEGGLAQGTLCVD